MNFICYHIYLSYRLTTWIDFCLKISLQIKSKRAIYDANIFINLMNQIIQVILFLTILILIIFIANKGTFLRNTRILFL